MKSTEEIKDFPFRWDKKPEITGLVGQALVLNSDWFLWFIIWFESDFFCSVQLIPGSSLTTCSQFFFVNPIENHLQIPLKLNKSLELGSSLPTPPPTHPIINQSGLSQSELPINVEDVNQPMGVADESNVENSNLPQRGVVLIKKGFHSRF